MNEDPRRPEALPSKSADALAPDFDPEGSDAEIPEDAFYSPDDPIAQREGAIPADAFFSPDDPIFRSGPVEGVVTTMSGISVGEMRGKGDLRWEIRHAANIMDALARDLKERGMEALRVHPETEPMDAMLRSYIAGFLVGRTDTQE
jgi:hypothetical protein